ncbi:hypothetical protein [Pontibacter korlensis]|nr:hypothetical protein [Pontibacter korlensis]
MKQKAKPKMPQAAPAALPQISVSAKGRNKLLKLQLKFNQKVKKISELKEELLKRKESISHIQKRVHDELQPLIEQLLEQRVALAHLLDRAYVLPFFRKREKEKLALFIEETTFELIDRYGRHELKELHDKYAELSFEDSQALVEEEANEIAEQLFWDVFGIEVDLDDPEFDSIEDELDQKARQREQEKQARQKTRKTKAQLAKEEKAKAELSNISKTSRRVYTNLAKLLHPDAEQDQQTRVWKEEAMKRVTQAYHQDDFFELLRLQMEFMQHEGQQLDSLPEEQLTYYTKLLDEQLGNLENALDLFSFSAEGELYFRYGGTSKQMDQKFSKEKKEILLDIEFMKEELKILQDPQQVRLMLKQLP